MSYYYSSLLHHHSRLGEIAGVLQEVVMHGEQHKRIASQLSRPPLHGGRYT